MDCKADTAKVGWLQYDQHLCYSKLDIMEISCCVSPSQNMSLFLNEGCHAVKFILIDINLFSHLQSNEETQSP